MTKQELLQDAKPILFNTEMVKAILEGKKNCTRRIIKPQPPHTGMYFDGLMPLNQAPKEGNAVFRREQNDGFCVWKPPYQVGDILWVRETWSDISGEGYPYWYKADFPLHWDADEVEIGIPVDLVADDYKWCPSIHMPKTAARIFLKVTAVRVERLQDITTVGIRAEGVYECFMCENEHCETKPLNKVLCSDTFINLWDSTIKKQDLDRYGWKANPWVWVIEFERVEDDGNINKN